MTRAPLGEIESMHYCIFIFAASCGRAAWRSRPVALVTRVGGVCIRLMHVYCSSGADFRIGRSILVVEVEVAATIVGDTDSMLVEEFTKRSELDRIRDVVHWPRDFIILEIFRVRGVSAPFRQQEKWLVLLGVGVPVSCLLVSLGPV